MRWIKPKDGDVKIKRKFAILPISTNDEIRWLEWVTIKYVYVDAKFSLFDSCWETEFIDDNKEV